MADIPESTNPVRIALEDVTPVIAAAFADDLCLIWSGEHRAYWVAGGNGYTTGAAYAGRWTIADAYQQTKHCDPTKQIAFERVNAARAAPPAIDREAVYADGYALVPAVATRAMVDAADACTDAYSAYAAMVQTGGEKPIFAADVLTEQWLADVLQDTLEMDWNTTDGARGIVRALKNGLVTFPQSGGQILSTLSADAIRQGEGETLALRAIKAVTATAKDGAAGLSRIMAIASAAGVKQQYSELLQDPDVALIVERPRTEWAHLFKPGIEGCALPPDGWQCSRARGHSGPCAATPASHASDGEKSHG